MDVKSSTAHSLKTDPVVFQAVLDGLKTYEIRKNDRGYAVDDMLVLRETVSTGAEMAAGAPLEYTGRTIAAKVSHMLEGPVYGLTEGWVIMSLAKLLREDDGELVTEGIQDIEDGYVTVFRDEYNLWVIPAWNKDGTIKWRVSLPKQPTMGQLRHLVRGLGGNP